MLACFLYTRVRVVYLFLCLCLSPCAGVPLCMLLSAHVCLCVRESQVLIDEATQAYEPDVLLPLLKGAERVVMVGDHCQLARW